MTCICIRIISSFHSSRAEFLFLPHLLLLIVSIGFVFVFGLSLLSIPAYYARIYVNIYYTIFRKLYQYHFTRTICAHFWPSVKSTLFLFYPNPMQIPYFVSNISFTNVHMSPIKPTVLSSALFHVDTGFIINLPFSNAFLFLLSSTKQFVSSYALRIYVGTFFF